MIIAGPCLINDTSREIDNAFETAEKLKEIDPDIIWFRAKLWGGGVTPDIYFPGIGHKGTSILRNIQEKYELNVGTEVQCESRLPMISGIDFIWTAARAMQVYGFLEAIGHYKGNFKHILVKRHPGVTQEDTWGIHDICEQRHGYKPIIVERGITISDRIDWQKWEPDYRFLINTLRERPDINLMLDPSHAAGIKENIFPYIKMAKVIGIRNFMIEVYADPGATQSDNDQAISIEEFKRMFDYIMK
jgi:3-deoxy-7-phosphoheptulonate synthase